MLERIRLAISIFWEKITQRATDYCSESLDRCNKCGGKLVFDEEVTTRRGETEVVGMICSECGDTIKQMIVRD